MSIAEEPDRTPAASTLDTGTTRLSKLSAALAAFRSRTMAGALADPSALQRLHDQISTALAPPESGVAAAGLAALDELHSLVVELERDRDALKAQIGSWRRARHAGTSYIAGQQ